MILIIAEKPIAGLRIANILSDGKLSRKSYRKHPYWEFSFQGEPAVLIPLKGHIVDVDFPEALGRWSEDTLLDIPRADLRRVITERTVASLLKSIAPQVSKIIIATDADREGEAIGLEAAELVMDFAGRQILTLRAYFSALTPSDIRRAFENLREPDRKLAESAFARRAVDLVWGAALTRAVSLYSGRRGKAFLSIGRVQSPTLAVVVEREREIQNFVPLEYWTIDAELAYGSERFSAHYAEGKIWQEPMAQMLYRTASSSKKGRVVRVEVRRDKISRPVPFDTTTFLREANRHLGISTSEALRVAESLYMKGLISYPRTDNQTYPPSLDFRAILSKLRTVKEYAPFADELLQQDVFRPSSGRKADDHPPIHPVDVPGGRLSEKERKVYDLIARRFLATLMAPGTLERRNIHINIGGVPFVSEGRRVVQKGWTAVYPAQLRDSPVPDVPEGTPLDVLSVKLSKQKTKPPSRYSEGELVKRMEALGLGTKSTRAEILSKLFARKYIYGRRSIRPTDLGLRLVEVLEQYAPELATPDMTADLEKELDAIARGERSVDDVLRVSAQRLVKVLEDLSKHRSEIRNLLGDARGAKA